MTATQRTIGLVVLICLTGLGLYFAKPVMKTLGLDWNSLRYRLTAEDGRFLDLMRGRLHEPGDSLAIAEVIPGDWTAVCVTEPYESEETIAETAGRPIQDAGWAAREDLWGLIAFKDDVSQVQQVKASINAVQPINGAECWTRDDNPTIVLRDRDDGQNRGILDIAIIPQQVSP